MQPNSENNHLGDRLDREVFDRQDRDDENQDRDLSAFSEQERAMLKSVVPPIPLQEERIQTTLRAARAPRRRAWQTTSFRMVAALLIVTLGAAGYWRWGGANSDDELSFGTAIQVANDPGTYTTSNVGAAAGRLWRAIRDLLEELHQQRAVTPEMRDAILTAIDSPVLQHDTYRGGFEAMTARVFDGERLAGEEATQLTDMICAGIAAIRQTAVDDPMKHRATVEILCRRLRAQATDPGPKKPVAARRNVSPRHVGLGQGAQARPYASAAAPSSITRNSSAWPGELKVADVQPAGGFHVTVVPAGTSIVACCPPSPSIVTVMVDEPV